MTDTEEKPTEKGIMKCAEWLVYCLGIGYTKGELDELEALFWKYKDKKGNLKTTLKPKEQ